MRYVFGLTEQAALNLAHNYEAWGKHTGSASAATLEDTSEGRKRCPFTEGVVGKIVYNVTDSSWGYITAQTNWTITATLAGGTDNDWDVGDEYYIGEPAFNVVEVPHLREIAYEQVTVVTPGTAINPTSDVRAKAVRVVNNNELLETAYAALTAAGVDATTSPPKGHPIFPLGDSWIFYVKENANELNIDCTVAGTALDVFILGI